MRSVFDQYKQPENQLTHALACALGEDRGLLTRFIKEIAGMIPPNIKHLQILEQQVPGEDSSYSEEETKRRGLPDAWIHDEEGWALLLQAKPWQEIFDFIRARIRMGDGATLTLRQLQPDSAQAE